MSKTKTNVVVTEKDESLNDLKMQFGDLLKTLAMFKTNISVLSKSKNIRKICK